jgi:hypothetical protein
VSRKEALSLRLEAYRLLSTQRLTSRLASRVVKRLFSKRHNVVSLSNSIIVISSSVEDGAAVSH